MIFFSRVYNKIISPFHHKEVKIKKESFDLNKELSICINILSKISGTNANEFVEEYDQSVFRKKYFNKIEELKKAKRFSETTNEFDCKVMYLIVRSIKPKLMVETGVLYGGFTAHILEGMKLNNQGKLFSIDLPLISAEKDLHGYLVMDDQKERWEMVLGDTRKQLPSLLHQLGKIDFFHHDSSHFPSIMSFEYNIAKKFISEGIITSHDVIGSKFQKSTFEKFVKRNKLSNYVFRNVGLCIINNQSLT